VTAIIAVALVLVLVGVEAPHSWNAVPMVHCRSLAVDGHNVC
jgi:hypothetical protein